MQNSEAIQAWFQGKMASFRILGLVSKNEIRSREFPLSSRSLRVKIINLDLVSMPEIGGNFFSVSSRSLRESVRNSLSRLDEREWLFQLRDENENFSYSISHIETRRDFFGFEMRSRKSLLQSRASRRDRDLLSSFSDFETITRVLSY